MLTLTERKLSDVFQYKGHDIQFNLTFDAILRCLELQKDSMFSDIEKLIGIFYILVPDYEKYEGVFQIEDISNLVATAFNMISEASQTEEISEEVMCFTEDAERIYSSFLKDYDINLLDEQGRLSWKEFTALLSNLSEDTPLMRAVYYRTVDLPSGKENAEKRQHILKMRKTFELKSTKKKREKELLKSMEEWKKSLI